MGNERRVPARKVEGGHLEGKVGPGRSSSRLLWVWTLWGIPSRGRGGSRLNRRETRAFVVPSQIPGKVSRNQEKGWGLETGVQKRGGRINLMGTDSGGGNKSAKVKHMDEKREGLRPDRNREGRQGQGIYPPKTEPRLNC